MTKPKGDYVVGRGRPPVETRYRPRQSGNPRGRPKGAKGVNTILREVLNSKVTILEGGRERTISKLEFILIRLANDAAQGKPAAVRTTLELAERYPMTDRAQAAAPTITKKMTAKEAADAYARMLEQDE